jgi:predicted Fe-Mo cluster-binding NifX family protein
MKVAFSTWKKRVSPVFDVSGEICLVDIEPGGKTKKTCKTLPHGQDRCLWLAREGVDVLVCGAISNHLQTRLEWMNIQVFPFIAGDISLVIKAWTENSFKAERFAMPGCCCRFGGSFKDNKEVKDMRGRNQGQGGRGGKGQGAGQGRNPRSGDVQGTGFSGSAGVCTCPKCGHQAPHERGVPCMNMKCPQCGEIMRGRV